MIEGEESWSDLSVTSVSSPNERSSFLASSIIYYVTLENKSLQTSVSAKTYIYVNLLVIYKQIM